MTRTNSLSLGATAAIGAIAVYFWMESRTEPTTTAPEVTITAQSASVSQQSAESSSLVSDGQAKVSEATEVETPSPEEEPAPPPLTALPPSAEQVTANWEDNQTRRTYGDLLKLMHLTPAEEGRLIALLAARYVGESEADERAARETEVAIQGLLRGHWPQFVAYEREMEERIYVMQCDEVMAAHDAGMAPEQRRKLVTMMAQTRRNLGEHPTNQPDAWMQVERVFQASVLGRAAEILQPDQLPAFREALQQQLEASQMAHDTVLGAISAPPGLPVPGR